MTPNSSEFSQSAFAPRFGMLPTGNRNPASIAVAAGVNASILLLAILLGFTAKKVIVQHKYEVTDLVVPTTPPPVKIKLPPSPKIQPPKLEVRVEQPKIDIPRPVPVPDLKPIPVDTPKPQIQVATTKPSVVLAPQPRAALASASAPAQQKQQQAISAVHFGDPNGAKPNPNAVRGAVQAVAFGSPAGGAGYGTGSPHGVVGSAGLGGNTSGSGIGAVAGHVASAGIPSVQKSAAIPSVVPSQAHTTNLEIVSKPTVQYTEEAREKKIQGAVILDVTFMADGRVVVHNVVKGLGYGLDEEAWRVAKEIHFHPGTRDGQPVDTRTNITIAFQLA